MIGLDTNVLIRYLVRDDEAQYERARRLLRRSVEGGEPVMVSLLALLEMEWVLRSRYASPKEDIAATISSLLDAAELTFEDEPSIEEALYLWKGSATDFADCLISARNRRLGCRTTATFDHKALQLTGFSQV
jgi:predicted nucleic-acid-binding protein